MLYFEKTNAKFLMGDFKKSLIIKVNDQTNDRLMALAGEICDAFDELDFGKVVIGAKMPSNAGGYYTKKQHCPGIYLPQSKDTCTIDLENQKFIIEFTPDEFSNFVHEASHFLHMERDKGFWLHPSIEGLEPLNDMNLLAESGVKKNAIFRRCAELEAGLRSVQLIKKYNLSKEFGELNHNNQINNILVYDINKQPWYSEYIKISKNLSKKAFVDLFNDIAKIFAKKYSLLNIPMDFMTIEENEINEIFKKYEVINE